MASGPARRTGDPAAADDPPHPAFAEYATESVPQAPVGAAGKDGRLDLAFARAGGETRLVRDFARVPFHVSGTLGHDPHPASETVYVQSPSGGVAQGDRHTVTVSVGADAIAHVSTGSATKVLSMERNYAAADLALSVAAGGHFDYVPAPTILHEDARLCQDVTVDLAPTASAVVGEVLVPGRLARGERFDFDRYRSTCEVRVDGEVRVADATHLDPGDADPAAPGVMGEFAVLGTLYVLAPDADAPSLSDRLHGRVTAAATRDASETSERGESVESDGASAESDGETVRAGATALPNATGVLVRALGHRADPVTHALRAAWDGARTDLLGVGAPADRRQ